MARAKSNAPTAPQTQIRIIAGRWRGRKLPVANIDGLRPTGDRIRETLFNWLMSDTAGARVLDLFSGAGSLGLESLSRGASELLMIERHPRAAQQLRENLKTLGAEGAKVIESDAISWLGGNPDKPFDIIFIDPPFSQDLWQASFDKLEAGGYLHSGSAIYVECERNHPLSTPPNWHLHRDKNAGNVSFRLYYRD